MAVKTGITWVDGLDQVMLAAYVIGVYRPKRDATWVRIVKAGIFPDILVFMGYRERPWDRLHKGVVHQVACHLALELELEGVG